MTYYFSSLYVKNMLFFSSLFFPLHKKCFIPELVLKCVMKTRKELNLIMIRMFYNETILQMMEWETC
ncbi:hypothetical protein XELAEV_18034943mg [Xenopus laevis]|uniref:Uncharacterized protein n=1 Tax=Xenopus laevis TaxID=8355 RepID=A0A974CF03_XENLA|nr:hypothetical protein XELAEV_18034943mg [Xenopus laevis]